MERLDARYPPDTSYESSGADVYDLGGDPLIAAGNAPVSGGIQDLYRFAIELSPVLPWIADRQGNLLEMDSRVEASIGVTRDACLGGGLRQRIHPEDERAVEAKWLTAKTGRLPFDLDLRVRLHDGGYRWFRMRGAPRLDTAGGILYWYGTLEDFHERKTAAEAVRWTADHDELTGLLNRTAFMSELNAYFARAHAEASGLALLLIDIGRLRPVNERFGHEFGDELLRQAAARLSSTILPGAIAARTSSDEFAIVLECAGPEGCEAVLALVQRMLDTPFVLDGRSHRFDGAIGLAVYPRDTASAEGLYRSADLALSEAKSGPRVVRQFDAAMRERNQLRLSTCAVVREALDRGSVFPFYQPQTDLRTGRVTGFEALLRWEHRQSGVQSAGAIASAFADAELAAALDRHMFALIAADMRAWREAGIDFGRIAINTSVVRFQSGDLADELLDRIASSSLDPSLFELEITEDVLIGRNPERLARDLDRLRSSGMTIALDDFGTGFASLVHLKQFTIDTLKIDRSFVKNMHDRTDGAIVSALVRLGKRLSIRTVAEGVETAAQRSELRRKGCDLGQGFLFSPAVPASDVPGLLQSSQGKTVAA